MEIAPSLSPDVTSSRVAAPEPPEEKKRPSRTGKQIVYDFIKAQSTPVGPKFVALRTHLKVSSVKVYCRRLIQEGKIVRTPVGYTLPVTSFEKDLEKRLMLDGQKHSLPKLHDIHLIFKPENIKLALKNPFIWHPTTNVFYDAPERGPDSKKLQSLDIHGDKTKAYPSGLPEYLARSFNTLDPDSIYQLWKVSKGNFKEINGGFQEQFDFHTYRLTFQLFGTGTIKVIIAASEHPLDLHQWRDTLTAINSLFLAKTGIEFFDISNFFHFERLHAGNDILAGSMDLAGATKLACTVRQFDDWLYRIYEKVLGDELFIRSEVCLENGNFAEHNLSAYNGFLALMNGGVTPSLINAQLFATKRDSDGTAQDVIRQQNQIHGLVKVAESQSHQLREQSSQIQELMKMVRQLASDTTGFHAASDMAKG